MKCQFKLIFNKYENSPNILPKLSDRKTLTPWNNFLEEVIDDFKRKGYNFNQLPEMYNMTVANEMDMTYDFFLNLNKCDLE